MTWSMWIDDWQQECCGSPFSVGDVRSFLVRLASAAELAEWPGDWPAEWMSSGRFEVVDAGDGWAADFDPLHVARRVVVGNGIQAEWRGPGAVGSTVEVTGLLLEDHHAEGFVATTAEVRRIRVVETTFVLTDERTFAPTWEGVTLREVETAPRWLRHDWPRPEVRVERYRSETGMLVEIAPSTPPRPLALAPSPPGA